MSHTSETRKRSTSSMWKRKERFCGLTCNQSTWWIETFDFEHAFAASNLGQPNLNDWFADSGSTEHMIISHHYFTSFEPVSHKWNVRGVGKDHKSLGVKGRGDIKIQVKIGDDVHYGVLWDVLYVPGIGVNLFSIGKATDRGITAIFEK